MRGAFFAVILSYLLLLGPSYPFAAMLAYVWIDIVKPQSLAYSLVNGLPLAMIAAVVVLISYGIQGRRRKAGDLLDRHHRHPTAPVIGLLAFFAIWITFTTISADPGINAWTKWDWAFKVVIFSMFIPLVIQSRLHIEAFLLTIIFSVVTISFSCGVKAALGSGGYGVLAILGGDNTGLSEGSTLSAVCMMQLPLMHYMYNHSMIFPNNRAFKLLLVAMAVVTMFAMVGTGARTGLIAGGLLFLLYALRSRFKVRIAIALILIFGAVQQFDLSGTAWGNRMASIGTYDQDSSAKGRIEVWKWTVGFALGNPLGGGFDAYKLNRIASVDDDGVHYYDLKEFRGKAFHNVFFEVMGEQGLVGFATYVAILGLTFLQLWRIRQRTRGDPAMTWCYDLATRIRDGLLVLLAGGMFIGIAYQCYIFYLVAIVVSLGRLVAAMAPPGASMPAPYAE